MLTTERETKSRQEKYGSFEIRSESKLADLGIEKNQNTEVTLNNIRSVDAIVEPKEKQSSKTNTIIHAGKKRLAVSDSYSKEVSENKKVAAGVASKEKVRTKNILMIAAYCLVVVALVTIIALNANALTGMAQKSQLLNNEIQQLNTEYSALSTELTSLTDEARIANLASNTLELTKTDATVFAMSVPTMRTVNEQTYQTNWFDKLCDKISGIIAA